MWHLEGMYLNSVHPDSFFIDSGLLKDCVGSKVKGMLYFRLLFLTISMNYNKKTAYRYFSRQDLSHFYYSIGIKLSEKTFSFPLLGHNSASVHEIWHRSFFLHAPHYVYIKLLLLAINVKKNYHYL